MVYCTLFDSNYLDRGLVCIDSLKKVDRNAKIYVLCMDDACFEILRAEQINDLITINLQEFEDDELLSIKGNRSRGEYCWSCTAKLIKYVLTKYAELKCTYIDADMKFYSNPEVLIDEMVKHGCTVQVVPHRFAPGLMMKEREKSSGQNCVQFNTFTNETKSMELLDKWINECLQDCSLENGGDQKYTDSWSDLDFVNCCDNLGAGVAPWNINRYKMISQNNITLYDRFSKETNNMIFYHFQDLVFPENGKARVIPYLSYWIIDKKLIDYIYTDYLSDLYKKNRYIYDKYGVECYIYKYITESAKSKRTIIEKIGRWIKKPICLKLHLISNRLLSIFRDSKALFDFPPELKK